MKKKKKKNINEQLLFKSNASNAHLWRNREFDRPNVELSCRYFSSTKVPNPFVVEWREKTLLRSIEQLHRNSTEPEWRNEENGWTIVVRPIRSLDAPQFDWSDCNEDSKPDTNPNPCWWPNLPHAERLQPDIVAHIFRFECKKIPWRRRRTAVQFDDQWTNQLTGNWRTIWLIVRWLIYWNERQENKFLRPMNLDNVCRRTLIWLCADGAKLRPSRIKTKKKKHSLVINAEVRITHSQSKIVRLSLTDICTSLVKRSNTYWKALYSVMAPDDVGTDDELDERGTAPSDSFQQPLTDVDPSRTNDSMNFFRHRAFHRGESLSMWFEEINAYQWPKDDDHHYHHRGGERDERSFTFVRRFFGVDRWKGNGRSEGKPAKRIIAGGGGGGGGAAG